MSAPALQASTFEARIADDRWSEKLGDVDALVATVLQHAASAMSEQGGVEILFTSDAEMRELNRQWRDLDKPTDVLSFPSEGPGEPGQSEPLGDIALGFETALHDAEAMGRPFEAHVSHLVIHGFLHLLGYDHIEAEDAKIMEPLESRILAGLGWPDPYSTGPYAANDSDEGKS